MFSKKSMYINLTLALGLGVATLGFASNASANAMYEANTTLSLTLASVKTEWGKTIDWGWDAYYEDWNGGNYRVQTSGDGTAGYTDTSADYVYVDMGIGDTVTTSTSVYGEAGVGTAESSILSFLDLFVYNNTDKSLEFYFEYEYKLSANVASSTWAAGDDALSSAGLILYDNYVDYVVDDVTADLLFSPLSASSGGKNWFSFTLDPLGGFNDWNWITAESDSIGFAVGAAVPEPTTLMMLSLGLAGLGASRFRKQS